jgi:hypothetical protein
MARFRAVAKGLGSGEAARLSDQRAVAEAGGWHGKVVVTVQAVGGRDWARVELAQVRGSGRIAVLWEGFLEDLPADDSDGKRPAPPETGVQRADRNT